MRLSLVISVDDTVFDAVAVRGSWQDGIRMAAELAYDGIELAVRNPEVIDARAVAHVLREAGLRVPAIGTGQAYLVDHLSLTHPDEGVRARAIERMEAHVHFAAQFGAAVIVGLIRGRVDGDRQAADARLAAALDRLLPLAARSNVRLLVEPINRYETDYLPTVEDVLRTIEAMEPSQLGILVDTFHMNIEEASVEGAIRRAGSRLAHVHVADSNRHAPGWGHLGFRTIVAALKEVGFDQYLSMEILPYPDPYRAAAQGVQHLRSLLGT